MKKLLTYILKYMLMVIGYIVLSVVFFAFYFLLIFSVMWLAYEL